MIAAIDIFFPIHKTMQNSDFFSNFEFLEISTSFLFIVYWSKIRPVSSEKYIVLYFTTIGVIIWDDLSQQQKYDLELFILVKNSRNVEVLDVNIEKLHMTGTQTVSQRDYFVTLRSE